MPREMLWQRMAARLPEQTDDELYGVLRPHEVPWRDRQQFLEACGYMLRPRYRPGWTPSWRATGGEPLDCEDGAPLPPQEHLIDAVRVSDSMLVYIKRVRTGDNESQIATRLSSAPLRDDPRNHCVPILHIFRDADDESIFYMVMPFLRLINRPPFETIENVVDFIDQVLEGLVFLHQQGVAHHDCTFMNIMMDANSLYPQGFHPVRTFCLPDGNMMAWPLPRTDKPIKYYFIDFGISVDFPPDATSRLVLGEKGRDQNVPELSNVVPYDPFKVDIFIVGNLLLHQFYTNYVNLGFLLPLIESMTRLEPDARPDAEEALALWVDLRRSIWTIQRRWRLKPLDEMWIAHAVRDIRFLIHATVYLCKKTSGWTVDLSGRLSIVVYLFLVVMFAKLLQL